MDRSLLARGVALLVTKPIYIEFAGMLPMLTRSNLQASSFWPRSTLARECQGNGKSLHRYATLRGARRRNFAAPCNLHKNAWSYASASRLLQDIPVLQFGLHARGALHPNPTMPC